MIGNNTYGGGGGKQKGVYPIDSSGLPTGDVIVPDGITSLAQKLFYQNENITSVKLPDTCTQLNMSCFYKCSKLKTVNIPSGVQTIPENCFYNTTALSSVSLPVSVTKIDSQAFSYSNVSNITFEDGAKVTLSTECFSRGKITNEGVENILAHASIVSPGIFCYCYSITDVTIPKSWTRMFQNCNNLKKVRLQGATKASNDTLWHFGDQAFNNCVSLEEFIFDIPEDRQQVQKIPNNAFYNCQKLPSITIPDTVQEIGDHAFDYCTSLTTLNIPSGVTKIGAYTFSASGSLDNLTIGDDASYSLGEYCFNNNPRVISAETVKKILAHANALGQSIFNACKSLPAELEAPKVSLRTFNECTSLVKVNVTGYLSTFNTGDAVFRGCTKLEEVTFAEGMITIGSSIFYGCTALKKVYLPSSITTSYQNGLTTASSSYYVFESCTALEDVQVGIDWNMSLRLNVSSKLTVESMVAMFNNLKDLTDATAKTLTLGSTNLAKLTDEQKAIATNKNWTLA